MIIKNLADIVTKAGISAVNFIKVWKKTSILVGVVAVFVAYKIAFPSGDQSEDYTVKTGPLSQVVKLTGTVKSSKDASLSFQSAGQVAFVGVNVGDDVTQGKVLATLSSADLQAVVLQSQASLENAQVTLDQLMQGAREEEIAIKQQAYDNAKNSLDQTYISIPDGVKNVDAVTSDVVKNKLSSMFIYNGTSYVLSFSSCDQKLQNQIEVARTNIESSLSNFQSKSGQISVISPKDDIDKAFDDAYNQTVLVNDLVSKVSSLIYSSCSITSTSLDSIRSNVSLAKTSMSTLFSDISSKRISLTSAKNTYNQTKRELDLIKAGSDPFVIRQKQALVSQAEASLMQAKANLGKTIIYAPFSGTISMISINKGETVSQGKEVIKILAKNAYQVEVKVPEVDIVKVKMGNDVNITLDSYGKSVVFKARVTEVSPEAQMEGNVPVYKVVVTFNETDGRIISGMTANVSIITENIKNTISIPSRFVKVNEEGRAFVLVKDKETTNEREVILGIRGEGGLVEIKSGLLDGEIITTFGIGERSAQKETK